MESLHNCMLPACKIWNIPQPPHKVLPFSPILGLNCTPKSCVQLYTEVRSEGLCEYTYLIMVVFFIADEQASDLGGSAADGTEYYPSGSPYRIQRHAANIRERKRMLRSAPAPRPPAPHTHERPPVKMWGSGGRGTRLPNLLASFRLSYFWERIRNLFSTKFSCCYCTTKFRVADGLWSSL